MSVEHARALDLMRALRPAEGSTDTIEFVRRRYEALCETFPVEPGVLVDNTSINGIEAIWLGNQSSTDIILFLHGGGGVFGSARGYAGWASRLAKASQFRVLVIDYRLAPEHPFPAGLEDALAVWRWLHSAGAPAGRKFVYGDSAGGSMALALAIWSRDLGLPLPTAVATVSAITDRSSFGVSFQTMASKDPVISRSSAQRNRQTYLGEADPTNVLASPLLADLANLPPIHMEVSDSECLYDDTILFFNKARQAGVPIECFQVPGTLHAFPLFPFLPESAESIDRVAGFFRNRPERP